MTKRIVLYIKGRPLLPRPHHLKGIGLPNVYLLNGLTVENDLDYGKLVTIEDLDALHRAIGLKIIGKPAPLSGDELRFLRKQLGLSQSDLAARLGISDQTLANYEKGKTEAGPADLMIRIVYLTRAFGAAAVASALPEAFKRAGLSPISIPASMRRRLTGRWEEKSAA